jgi:glycine/D-amino acid oxidase-like deaminating enzyme
MSARFDVGVVGAGVMGATTALFLARAGMRVVLIDRGELCREASGVNAGTLTLHMTRAALIPYAQAGWRMWTTADQWLGSGVDAVATEGLALAFTDAEAELLERRAAVRREHGADIRVIDRPRALEIEPGLNAKLLKAAYCATDGYASAYFTGRAYRRALVEAGATIAEQRPVVGIDGNDREFVVHAASGERWEARRVVLAGGVWLGEMLRWFGNG